MVKHNYPYRPMNHKSKLRANINRDENYRLLGLIKGSSFMLSIMFLALVAGQWVIGDAVFPASSFSIPGCAKAATVCAVGGLGFAGLQERRKRKITEVFYEMVEEIDAQQQSKGD